MSLKNLTCLRFKRVGSLVAQPKLEPAYLQIIQIGFNISKEYCSLMSTRDFTSYYKISNRKLL